MGPMMAKPTTLYGAGAPSGRYGTWTTESAVVSIPSAGTWNLAFAVEGTGTVASQTGNIYVGVDAVNYPPTDYGDLVLGIISSSTASQMASTDVRIGTNATDWEVSDPSDFNANKDDTTGTDDEDLTIPTFTIGSTTNFTVPVTLNTAALNGNAATVARHHCSASTV